MSSTEEKPPREVVIFGKEGLSDVTLVVENKEFKVHKMSLALLSDYFETLFFGDFKEKGQDRIELDADPLAFQRMLNFVYKGNFGDEDFLKCPSKLTDTSKNYGIENYALYGVLKYFDMKTAAERFWSVVDEFRCHPKKIGDFWIRDCENCMNRTLINAIYDEAISTTRYTSRAVTAWMQKYYPIVPLLAYTGEAALPRILKEMV